jgi:dihydroorotate dehydrogenase electron transfer subunit
MMKAVAELSTERGVPCQVSMETFMPCGVGICVGCAMARPDGSYARACTDGPVFFAGEVKW